MLGPFKERCRVKVKAIIPGPKFSLMPVSPDQAAQRRCHGKIEIQRGVVAVDECRKRLHDFRFGGGIQVFVFGRDPSGDADKGNRGTKNRHREQCGSQMSFRCQRTSRGNQKDCEQDWYRAGCQRS